MSLNKRDIQYERLNVVYNNNRFQNGRFIKCKNYRLCNKLLQCPHRNNNNNDYNYLCYYCMGIKWGELEFKINDEECIICKTICKTHVKFPYCTHWFCVICSNKILIWDSSLYHLSPVKFGCPPCPNACDNPERGKQCNCNEYQRIIDKWKRNNIDDYNQWRALEDESIELSETTEGSAFGSFTCPLCRQNQYPDPE